MFRRLAIFSVISVNIGYTFFLFPLLGFIYPDKVPFTIYNLLAFVAINTIWGIILAIITYLIIHIFKTSLTKATVLSITLLWTVFWLISRSTTSNIITMNNTTIIIIDSIAALITLITLLTLNKYYLKTSNQRNAESIKT